LHAGWRRTPTRRRGDRQRRSAGGRIHKPWSRRCAPARWWRLWNRGKGGELYAPVASYSAVRDESGQVCNFVGLYADITSLKKHEQVLEGLAYRDALAGLR